MTDGIVCSFSRRWSKGGFTGGATGGEVWCCWVFCLLICFNLPPTEKREDWGGFSTWGVIRGVYFSTKKIVRGKLYFRVAI